MNGPCRGCQANVICFLQDKCQVEANKEAEQAKQENDTFINDALNYGMGAVTQIAPGEEPGSSSIWEDIREAQQTLRDSIDWTGIGRPHIEGWDFFLVVDDPQIEDAPEWIEEVAPFTEEMYDLLCQWDAERLEAQDPDQLDLFDDRIVDGPIVMRASGKEMFTDYAVDFLVEGMGLRPGQSSSIAEQLYRLFVYFSEEAE